MQLGSASTSGGFMKFALFGDIHANLEALEAVLEDAEKNECTHYACIGDIVGYNANPSECLAIWMTRISRVFRRFVLKKNQVQLCPVSISSASP